MKRRCRSSSARSASATVMYSASSPSSSPPCSSLGPLAPAPASQEAGSARGAVARRSVSDVPLRVSSPLPSFSTPLYARRRASSSAATAASSSRRSRSSRSARSSCRCRCSASRRRASSTPLRAIADGSSCPPRRTRFPSRLGGAGCRAGCRGCCRVGWVREARPARGTTGPGRPDPGRAAVVRWAAAPPSALGQSVRSAG
mmetsp:Transcript_5462/g.16356  ORF Transcript_5462/g.16356 Transcript_5462/m.16356 type:complete len:201 (+) Transcript_5462:609-1211(+)